MLSELACNCSHRYVCTRYVHTVWIKRYFHTEILLVKQTSFNLPATLDSNTLLLPTLICDFR